MPLTEAEQNELDDLELQQLEHEQALAKKAAPETAAPTSHGASGTWEDDSITIPIGGTPEEGGVNLKIPNPKALANTVANMGIRGGAPAAGQALGALGGPLAEVTVPVGGLIGGITGEILANKREGVPTTFSKLASAAISGLIPGGSMAKTGAQVAGRAALEGGLNLATAELQSMADTGEAASPAQAAIATLGGAAGGAMAGVSARTPLKQTERQTAEAMKRETASALRPDGFVVPPHLLGVGIAASDAGKTAIEQAASIKNALATQKNSREILGLAPDTSPIAMRDPKTGKLDVSKEFDRIRAQDYGPYQEIDALQKDAYEELIALKRTSDPQELAARLSTPEGQKIAVMAAADVDHLKSLRQKASDAFEKFKNGDPDSFDVYKSNQAQAEAMEDIIDQAGKLSGNPKLLGDLQAARKKIAQTYAIQNATSRSSGLVEPKYLGAAFEAGAPFTGKLREIAQFSADFPEATRALGGTPGVGNLRGIAGGAMMMHGGPQVAIGAFTRYAGGPARAILLSDVVQRGMLSPQERLSVSQQLARFLATNAKNERAAQEDPEAQP